MRLGVAPGLGRVSWFGRGPHECYPDRQAGAPLRVHNVPSVLDLHVPYVFPSGCSWPGLPAGAACLQQETGVLWLTKDCGGRVCELACAFAAAGESGGRSDVRWVALQGGGGGEGLLASALGGAAMQVSASPYSLESFEKARHDHELEVRPVSRRI